MEPNLNSLQQKNIDGVYGSNKSSNKTNIVTFSSETSLIRVIIEKVDQMMTLVGELVIIQAMLAQTASKSDPVIFEKLYSGMN